MVNILFVSSELVRKPCRTPLTLVWNETRVSACTFRVNKWCIGELHWWARQSVRKSKKSTRRIFFATWASGVKEQGYEWTLVWLVVGRVRVSLNVILMRQGETALHVAAHTYWRHTEFLLSTGGREEHSEYIMQTDVWGNQRKHSATCRCRLSLSTQSARETAGN